MSNTLAPMGSATNPLVSEEPVKLARSFVADRFITDHVQTIACFQGAWLTYSGSRWTGISEDQLFNDVFLWLEDAHVAIPRANGTTVIRRVAPGVATVDSVVSALRAICTVPFLRLPVWVHDREHRPDPDLCIAFRDVIISCDPANPVSIPRDETWFSPAILPCDYNPEAECPRWLQALDEWSGSDPSWKTLLQRWFGYCLLGTRRHAKWLLLEGATRGGKSTITRVLSHLVGRPGFVSMSLDDLAGPFGLDGLSPCTVLNITEASDLDRLASHRVARIVKCILGEDPVTINAKHKAQVHNVLIRAAPVMTANAIPALPNDGSGLSSKMLVLPFRTSFDGCSNRPAPQLDLLETLISETPGIAAWAVQGALSLLSLPTSEHWPDPAGVHAVREQFAVKGNPVAAFVRARFREDPDSFVPSWLVWNEWESWKRATGTRIDVPRNGLSLLLKEKSGWPLEPSRKGDTGTRGIRGFSLLKNTDDEV